MMENDTRRMKAVIKDPQHCKRLAESVQILNDRQDFMDVCFVCARGHRVFAHKLLLCSVSTHMKEIFMDNPDKNDLITVHMPDFEGRLLKLMLDFLYEGSLTVVSNDYLELKSLMALLGVTLKKSRNDKTNQQSADGTCQFGDLTAAPSSQLIQTQPQLVYIQAAGPNNQGPVQYVLAAPAMVSQGQVMQMAPNSTSSLPQGQMMQMATPNTSLPQGQMMQVTTPSSLPQGQMMQVATPPASLPQGPIMQANGQMMMQMTQATAPGQMIQIATPTTSLPQSQIMQMAPTIMSQANGQMVQGGGPQVVTTPMQQNNMMQVIPQSSAQVPQPTQRPQYVMASTANNMTTSRAQAQYTQPQTTTQRAIVRPRSTTQPHGPIRTNANNTIRTRRMARAPVPMGQNRSLTASRIIQRTRHSAQ